ncbi:Histidine kinase (fragment) [Thiocapsa sp. KS1]
MARQHTPQREPTDLNAAIRSALDVVDYSLRSTGIELALALDPRLPPIPADAGQLGQVFLNLFTNALHALGEVPGPRRLDVASRWDEPAQRVVIEVADTGSGIPPEIRPRIFEPFFTTKAMGEGTGVGLSVSLGLVQSHGGTLELLAPDGRGARFRITLPVTSALGSAPLQAAEHPPVEDSGLRVLIVDDEAEIAEILHDVLVPAGYSVAIAHTGREALASLSTSRFDLVLTDLKMPDLDGPSLYREIQIQHPHLAARVVAITGDTLGGSARRFLEETGLAVVHKPFTPEDILRAAERATAGGANDTPG